MQADHFHNHAVSSLRNIFFHPGIFSSSRFVDAAEAVALHKSDCVQGCREGGLARMLPTEWPRGGSTGAVWRETQGGKGGFQRVLESDALVVIFRRTCSSKNSSNQMRYPLYHLLRGTFSVILTQR